MKASIVLNTNEKIRTSEKVILSLGGKESLIVGINATYETKIIAMFCIRFAMPSF